MIISDVSAVPPGSIVSSPVSPAPHQQHSDEEPRTLTNKAERGISMLKDPHVSTSSALSNPIYGKVDDISNISQAVSSGENDYEDLDDNDNGRCCAPYEVPVECGAGTKGKVTSPHGKSDTVNAGRASATVIENRNAVDSDVENVRAIHNRSCQSQASEV